MSGTWNVPTALAFVGNVNVGQTHSRTQDVAGFDGQVGLVESSRQSHDMIGLLSLQLSHDPRRFVTTMRVEGRLHFMILLPELGIR